MRREPREKEPTALEWILPGSAGSLPASPGDQPIFLARSGGGRYSDFLSQSPNLRRKEGRPQTRRHEGVPTPPLSLPLGAGPVSARTPPPAHLSRAPRPPPRTVTATSPRPAAPLPAPHGLSSRGPGPPPPAQPGRPVPPYLAGGGCGDSSAAPHVPVPHFPVRHAAVRPHRATAAAASGPRPHRPDSTRRKAGSVGGSPGGGGGSSPAPHATHLPETGNGCTPPPITGLAVTRGGAHSRGGGGSPKARRPRGNGAGSDRRDMSLRTAGQSGGGGGGPHAAVWPITGDSKGGSLVSRRGLGRVWRLLGPRRGGGAQEEVGQLESEERKGLSPSVQSRLPGSLGQVAPSLPLAPGKFWDVNPRRRQGSLI